MKNDLRPEHLSQEVTVVLPLGVVLRISDAHLAAPQALISGRIPELAGLDSLPAIGSELGGGIYAGLTLHPGNVYAEKALESESLSKKLGERKPMKKTHEENVADAAVKFRDSLAPKADQMVHAAQDASRAYGRCRGADPRRPSDAARR